jgi:hypothetical protein
MERTNRRHVHVNGKRNRVKEERAPFAAIEADDWVHELIAMTRPGVEIEFPHRGIDEREVPFVYDDFR